MLRSLSHLILQRGYYKEQIRTQQSLETENWDGLLAVTFKQEITKIICKHDLTLAALLPAALSVLRSPSEPCRTISCDIQVRTAAQEHGLSSSKSYPEAVLPDLFPQPTFLLALLYGTLGLSGVRIRTIELIP